jgi:beta-galactosidase
MIRKALPFHQKDFKNALLRLTWLLAILMPGQLLAQVPEIGAQIWLENGMTAKEIDGHFAILESQGMKVTRLFVMWNFIEKADGSYDYTLYDNAFESAARHKVGIVATLMPNFGPKHKSYVYKTQDGAIAKTQAQLEEGHVYIQKIVERYKDNGALSAWMLMNEPGQLPSPDELAMSRFKVRMKGKYGSIDSLNRAWISNFDSFEAVSFNPAWAAGGWTWPVSYMDWQFFWREQMTWYLADVAKTIRQYDSKTEIHVNPHALLDIPHRYELPEWRKFLTSLGSSIHPVWHFNLLERKDFAMGVSYVCDLVRTAAAPNPFWITELQGGHNMYTGKFPMIPEGNEVQSWLWTGAAAGAKKTIFWCLNYRKQGTEGAEWSMLDLDGKPTARLEKAGEVTASFSKLGDGFWKDAKPYDYKVTILLSPESRFVQERAASSEKLGVRNKDAHQLAILGTYKALMANGIQPNVQYLDDTVAFGQNAENDRVYLLPHGTSLTQAQIGRLTALVAKGNKLIVTGTTGFFNEHERYSGTDSGKAFETLVGGRFKEILPSVDKRMLKVNGGVELPFDGFASNARLTSTTANFIFDRADCSMIRNRLGKGQVIWLPATVDISAFTYGALPLAKWLKMSLQEFGVDHGTLKKANAELVLRKMVGGDGSEMLSIYNASKTVQKIELGARWTKKPVYGTADTKFVSAGVYLLQPLKTTILKK